MTEIRSQVLSIAGHIIEGDLLISAQEISELRSLVAHLVKYKHNADFDLPGAHALFFETPIDRVPERKLFLQYNYAKMRVHQLTEQLRIDSPSSEICRQLLEAVARADELRDAVTEYSLKEGGFVWRLAIRFCGSEDNALYAEYWSDANKALARAIEGFDVASSASFRTYACRVVQNAMKNLYRRIKAEREKGATVSLDGLEIAEIPQSKLSLDPETAQLMDEYGTTVAGVDEGLAKSFWRFEICFLAHRETRIREQRQKLSIEGHGMPTVGISDFVSIEPKYPVGLSSERSRITIPVEWDYWWNRRQAWAQGAGCSVDK